MNNHDYNCQETTHSYETGAASQQQTFDYLLPRKTVEKLSGLSRATIYRLIKSGKFPRPLSIGTGSVRWRQSDVLAWQQALSPSSRE